MPAVERMLATSRGVELQNRQVYHSDKHWIQNCNMGPYGDPHTSSAYHWLSWFHGTM